MATDEEIANQALARVGAESITSGEWTTPTNERSRVVKNSWPFVRQAVLREHPWNVVTTREKLLKEGIANEGLKPQFDYASSYALPTDCLRVLEVDTDEQWRVERAPVATGSEVGYSASYPQVQSGIVIVQTSTNHHLQDKDRIVLNSATHVGLENTVQTVEVVLPQLIYLREVDPTGFVAGSSSGTLQKVTMSPAIVTDETGLLSVRYIQDVTDPSDFDPMLTEALVLRLACEIVERVTDSTSKRDLLMAEYQRFMREVKHIEGEEQSPSEFEEDVWITSRY